MPTDATRAMPAPGMAEISHQPCGTVSEEWLREEEAARREFDRAVREWLAGAPEEVIRVR